MSEDNIYTALAARGIARGTHREGSENEVTASIAALMTSSIGPETRYAVYAALMSPAYTLPQRAFGSEGVYADQPFGSGVPDLVVFDHDMRIRTVVEVKYGAKANFTWLQTYLNTADRRFEDEVARTFAPHGNCDWHPVKPDWSCDFDCTGHTRKRMGDGHSRAGVSQIDFYRCSSAWVRPTKRKHTLTLQDPATARWVVLDLDNHAGRAVDALFYWPHSATQWTVTGYGTFDSAIIDAYDAAMDRCGPDSTDVDLLASLLAKLAKTTN